MPHQDLPKQHIKSCRHSRLRHAETACPDVPDLHPSKKDTRKIDKSEDDKVNPSVNAQTADTDSRTLDALLEKCELWVLPEDAQGAFQSAIERLFYSEYFTVGKARLPKERVRSHLWQIDGMVLQDAYQKLRANTVQKVKNSTAYLMSTLFNAIHEGQSDLY